MQWHLENPLTPCLLQPRATIAEEALGAWETVVPDLSLSSAIHDLPDLIRLIKARAGTDADQTSIFSPCVGSGVRTRGCRIHFLDFWQAFSSSAVAAGAQPVGLAAELETLRDNVVLRLEGRGLPAWALVEEVHQLAPSSVQPRFWQSAAASLDHDTAAAIAIPDLTELLVAWIRDTASQPSATSVPAAARCRGIPVRLHIYDCTRHDNMQRLNSVFAHKMSPIKFGGIFHAGVEVNGFEWSFDYQPDPCKPGVSCALPRTAPQHHYRQTIELGFTHLSEDAIANIVSQLIEEYPGNGYNLLHRNCCTFCDDFVMRLGIGSIPTWVHRVARLAAGLNSACRIAQGAAPNISDRLKTISTAAAPPKRWRPPTPPPARRCPSRCQAKCLPEEIAGFVEI